MKQFAANPVYKFFLFPIGQILLFAMGASVILSLATVLLAYVFKFNVTDFDLVERTMLILPQVIINGLTIGFVYSTIALGYTMVYGVLEFINFRTVRSSWWAVLWGFSLWRTLNMRVFLPT